MTGRFITVIPTRIFIRLLRVGLLEVWSLNKCRLSTCAGRRRSPRTQTGGLRLAYATRSSTRSSRLRIDPSPGLGENELCRHRIALVRWYKITLRLSSVVRVTFSSVSRRRHREVWAKIFHFTRNVFYFMRGLCYFTSSRNNWHRNSRVHNPQSLPKLSGSQTVYSFFHRRRDYRPSRYCWKE